MHPLLAIILGIGMAGCAGRSLDSSFFPLRELEGRVEDEEVIRLPSFPGQKGVLLGLVATEPEEIKGWTVVFRFESADDPSYRLLSASRGRLFRVIGEEGQGVISGDSIVFVSNHAPTFTPVEEQQANKAAHPTSTADTFRADARPAPAVLVADL